MINKVSKPRMQLMLQLERLELSDKEKQEWLEMFDRKDKSVKERLRNYSQRRYADAHPNFIPGMYNGKIHWSYADRTATTKFLTLRCVSCHRIVQLKPLPSCTNASHHKYYESRLKKSREFQWNKHHNK